MIIVGQKYGRLTAIKKNGLLRSGHVTWLFKCDCGKDHVAAGTKVSTGRTKSCGCVHFKGTAIELSARRAWKCRYEKDGCSFEVFMKLSQQNCVYCGSPPLNISNGNRKTSIERRANGNFIYNGLDRVDSSKDHSEDNVVACCKTCNAMKRNYSLEFFLDHIKKIYTHSFNDVTSEIEHSQ